MSPKPVDVRRALETLRRERPPAEATERARLALSSPSPRRSLARPLAPIMITAALALVVLTPRVHTGAAWAQTLAATFDSPACHLVDRGVEGRLALEEWRSGVKRATVLYTGNGQVLTEMRNDGKRKVNFFDWLALPASRGEAIPPNARRYAIVSRDATGGRRFYEFPLGGVNVALNDPDIAVVGHQDATEGRPETYRLRQTIRLGGKPLGKPREITAEVDPRTRRIRALVEPSRTIRGRTVTHRTEVDYPASLPASTFAPRVQVAKVDATYDDGAQERAVQRTLREGLAKRGPVTLRALFLDADGALWAYWTGAPATRSFATPGVPLEAGASRNAYASGLTGARRVPRTTLGATVDLEVPYPGGVARFRGVPIRRVGLVNDVQGVLMAYRPAP